MGNYSLIQRKNFLNFWGWLRLALIQFQDLIVIISICLSRWSRPRNGFFYHVIVFGWLNQRCVNVQWCIIPNRKIIGVCVKFKAWEAGLIEVDAAAKMPLPVFKVVVRIFVFEVLYNFLLFFGQVRKKKVVVCLNSTSRHSKFNEVRIFLWFALINKVLNAHHWLRLPVRELAVNCRLIKLTSRA